MPGGTTPGSLTIDAVSRVPSGEVKVIVPPPGAASVTSLTPRSLLTIQRNSVADEFVPSVAVTVTSNTPGIAASVGMVPVISPVCAFIDKPLGRPVAE